MENLEMVKKEKAGTAKKEQSSSREHKTVRCDRARDRRREKVQ